MSRSFKEAGVTKRGAAVLAGLTLFAPAAFVAAGQAEPASGVSAVVLSRGTLPPFQVSSDKDGPIDLKAKSKAPMDMVVRQHDYAPGSTTGWHSHPGPVFITVTKGTLHYYAYDDQNCTRHEVTAGQSFVDDGHGHVVRNETGEPAQDISVITASTDKAQPFRTNLPNPGPHCPF